jgi:hypothetical protein
MDGDTIVSILLVPQVEKAVLYGEASLVTFEGFQSFDVTCHYMPDLAGFGPQYMSFGFILINPNTGQVLAIERMVLLPNDTNDWAGSIEFGNPTQPVVAGQVIVFPMTADGSGFVVPVLAGTLQSPA